MSRGGPRKGKAGKSYANRTDLNAKALPATAVPGQPYGVAGAQLASQKIAPMASGPLQSAPQQGAFQPPAGPAPGSFGDLTDPTKRPDESFMTGVDAGPGAGSEVLSADPQVAVTLRSLALLNSLGDDVSPQVAMIRSYLQAQASNGGNQ